MSAFTVMRGGDTPEEVQFSEVEGLGGHDTDIDFSISSVVSEKECIIQFYDVEGLGEHDSERAFSNCIQLSEVEGLSPNQIGSHDTYDTGVFYLEGGTTSDNHDAMEIEHDKDLDDTGSFNLEGGTNCDLSDDDPEVDDDSRRASCSEMLYSKRDDHNEGIMKILCTRCCSSDCTSTVSRKEALDASSLFQSKTLYEQRCWILQYLNTHCKCIDRRKHFVFSVGTASVCMEAWRLIHGIGRKRLWEMRRLCQNGAKVPLPPNTHQKGKRKSAVHAAITWMKNFAAKCGDKMPDSPRIHLPSCQSRNAVYKMMKAELSEINLGVCSKSHFLKLWREELTHIVIPSVNRFAKCDICTSIKTRLQHCTDSKQRNHLNNARDKHLLQQRTEREKYYKHQRKAKANPSKYISIIIDGMDQRSTHIPHFVQESKSTNGAWKLPTHITGGIVHGHGQHAFVDFNEFPHDPNITITVILQILKKYAPNLPPVLYLQLDNCGRENKNRFVLAFLSLLVELDVFKKVKVSFLMVGHTHEDIDQFFSRLSTRLTKTNVPTVDVLLETIPKAYNRGVTTSERLQEVYDVKEWLGDSIEEVSQHSRPHVFRIQKGVDGRAVIDTKLWSSSPDWTSPGGSSLHLLTHHPDGTPVNVRPNFQKVDLPRLEQHIARMKPFLTAEAMETWKTTLNQLHMEDRGEAEFNSHWPLVDLLLNGERERELCLQMSGSSSTHESEVEEEEGPCQIYIGKKKRAKRVLTQIGNMMAFYLNEYNPEWPQIGQVIDTRPGQLQVHWYTGTATSQWEPLLIDQQPWLEWVQDSAAISPPFELTRSSRLSGEIQADLKELKEKYMV